MMMSASLMAVCHNDETLKVTLSDDTEIDEEYFEFVSSGSELHVASSSEETPKEVQALATFLHHCLQNQPQVYDRIMGILRESSQSPKGAEILGLLSVLSQDSASVSDRKCDQEWFKGLDTKFKTKESVLRNSAEMRMRGYFEQAKKELLADGPSSSGPARQAIEFFRQELKSCGHNAAYFDRSASKCLRLCNSDGLFECEGQYDSPRCFSSHFINPYACREARIVFSTWNLDHVIEKSRAILPTLKKALKGPRAESVNLPYFHSLLFRHKCEKEGEGAEGNLKLVHIACHIKKPHEDRCDQGKIYAEKKCSEDKTNGCDVIDGRLVTQFQSRSCGVTSSTISINTRRRKRTGIEVHSVRRSKRLCLVTRKKSKRQNVHKHPYEISNL
ncbi:DNA fragmentation factor subunit beta-like isoform X2 [Penaeus chinensis]|uniref:DNA fragmentation factor subunit beta-like isoform X2 n=1 Tax=Penaeus chinensis TaxID=139456 RepID=UPI001FB74B8A|nr:DNA fragmentation factor subunit beta-like isoform X2 [Penaeus chinensis]